MAKPKTEAVIELWPVADLTPYDLNSKKHDAAQVGKIVAAIQRFGWADANAIIVNKNGVILAGHGRRLAAIELGMKTVKVQVLSHLTPDEERAFRLAENRVGVSDLDPELLRLELASLDASMTGIFDDKEIEFMEVDLGEMNADVFVTDMGAVLEDQRRDTEARAEAAVGEGARVLLSKAFGFKDISAAGAIAITRLMAKAESSTGLENDAALVAFAAALG